MAELPPPQVSLEDVLHQVEQELHAFSNTRKLDFKDWTHEENAAVRATAEDTLHVKGRLVSALYALFLAKDRKLKQECLNTLAGVQFYAHKLLYELNRTQGAELTDLRVQFSTLRQRATALQNVIDDLETRLTQTRKDLRTSQDEAQTLEDQLRQEVAENQKKIAALTLEQQDRDRENAKQLLDRETRNEELLLRDQEHQTVLEAKQDEIERLESNSLQAQIQIRRDTEEIMALEQRVSDLEAEIKSHRCPVSPEDLKDELTELRRAHAKCFPALHEMRTAVRESEQEVLLLTAQLGSSEEKLAGLEDRIDQLQRELKETHGDAAVETELRNQLRALEVAHFSCAATKNRWIQTAQEQRSEKECVIRTVANREREVDQHRETISHLHEELSKKDAECGIATQEVRFLRGQLSKIRDVEENVSQVSDLTWDEPRQRRPETGFNKNDERQLASNFEPTLYEEEADTPPLYKEQTNALTRNEEKRILSRNRDVHGKARDYEQPIKTILKHTTPPRRASPELQRQHAARGRRGKRGGDGSSPSDSSTSSSEDEETRARARAQAHREYRKSTKGKETSETTLKNIKQLRQLLPLYSKASKTRIENHVAMYANLMEALEFDTDKQLVRYLSWTFGTDSQAFFLSRDVREFPRWKDYKREVIKHFSPRRNQQEALQYALSLTCSENQNPREFLQELKHAFAQAQEVVELEGSQFRNTFFYGLPPVMRTQMARDFNSKRSVKWILKQAVNIFEVSGMPSIPATKEVVPKAKGAGPSKVLEISKADETALESGTTQGEKVEKRKQKKPPAKQKEVSAGGASGSQTVSPTPEQKTFWVSAKYKGTRPQPNYVYQPKPVVDPNSRNTSDEEPAPRWDANRSAQEGGQDKRILSRDQQEGSSDQRSYSTQNSFRPYQARERSPERYPRPSLDNQRVENLEQQLKEIKEIMSRMSNSGRSSRATTPSMLPDSGQE